MQQIKHVEEVLERKGQTNRRAETMAEVQVFGWMAPGPAPLLIILLCTIYDLCSAHSDTRRNSSKGPFMQIVRGFRVRLLLLRARRREFHADPARAASNVPTKLFGARKLT